MYDDGTIYNVGTAVAPSDHCGPVICAPSDKPPIVAWTNHPSVDQNVHYKIGTVNGDFSSLGSELTLDVGTDATYVHLWRRPATDSLLMLSRDNLRTWRFWTSANWGSSWSGPTALWDMGSGSHSYMRTSQSGSTIHCMLHDHNSAGLTDHRIFYTAINLATGSITNAAGTVLGNLSGTGLPITPATANLDVVYDPGSDVATGICAPGRTSTPEMVIMTFAVDIGTDAVYRWVHWDGSAWQTEEIGPAEAFGNDDRFVGNSEFTDDFGHFYLANDNGSGWVIEDWEWTGSAWTTTEVVAPASDHITLVRPIVCYGESDLAAWHRLSSYTNYDAFTASLAGP